MKSAWQKFTLWSRLIAVGLAGLYLLLFVWKNGENKIKINFLFKESNEISIIPLLFFTSIISIIGWMLLLTIFRTVRQMREIQRRAYLEKLEKDHKDRLDKATRLQSRELSDQIAPPSNPTGT